MSRRVAAIAFDAAELSLVERGIAEGWLPTLRELRRRGAFGRLRSTSGELVGSTWPTFYSGLLPPEHGVFSFPQWHPAEMAYRRPDPAWLPTLVPFYRRFDQDGPRVVAIDMPFAPPPTPFNGVEITSWGTHMKAGPPDAYPASLRRWLARTHGTAPMRDEVYGTQPPAALLRLRDALIRIAGCEADLASDLARREDWDLLLVGFGSAHRGGHKLWDLAGVHGTCTDVERAAVGDALRQIYIACDGAIGRLLAGLGDDVTTLVFALNGMTATSSHYFLLPEMLRRVLERDTSDRSRERPPPAGTLRRLRAAVPIEYRSAVKDRLPVPIKDALGRFWRRDGQRDWSRTRAFCLIGGDLEGLVQINLRGRERDGIVEAGAAYEELCDEIASGLTSFVDADTGLPIVAEVVRTDRLWREAERRHPLPDLVVRWAERSPTGLRVLRSGRFGAFANPHVGGLADGRSGHHQPLGWVIGTGPTMAPQSSFEDAFATDLTATIHALLRVPMPHGMRGPPIAALCGEDAPRPTAKAS